MQVKHTAGQIHASIRRFTDFSQDLLAADMQTFDDRITLLTDFAKTDPVFLTIHEQLVTRKSANFADWFKSQGDNHGIRLRGFSFPTDLDDRVAIQYQFLVYAAEQGRSFIKSLLGWFYSKSASVDVYIQKFCNAVLQPLFRELGYRLQEIEGNLPADKALLVESGFLQIIHNQGSIIQQFATGDGNSQTASVANQNADVGNLLKELRTLADKSNLDAESAQSSKDIIETVERELSQPKPKRTIVETLLKALPFATAAMGLIAAIIKAVWS
jgi:hypothetical protein